MQPDDTPGAFALLESLDEPGPALPISDARAAALVGTAIAQASAPVRPPRRILRWTTAATVLFGGAAAAAWYTQQAPKEIPLVGTPEPVPIPSARLPERVRVPEVEPVTPKPTGAQDLLRLANQHRARKQWQKAQSLYRRVEREYAGSGPAEVAMLADASLRLEHLRDARGALALYKKAMAGPLREEAAFGVAESWRALHNPAAEKRSLESFLSEYADSPMAPRARERLEQLH